MNENRPGGSSGDSCSLLSHLWWAGVAAVSGKRAVATALARDGPFPADLAIAVGKASCDMFLGACASVSPATRSIIVSKYGHIEPACRSRPATEVIEAGHPVPDRNSLAAGEAVLRAVTRAGQRDRLLLLVSGGASALAEALQPGDGLGELQALTGGLLASGESIATINERRGRMSRIKSGRLLGCFRGAEARVYALSDVEGDDLATIGGGIGDPVRASAAVKARVIASNAVARNAAAEEAARLGFEVRVNQESLYTDVVTAGDAIARALNGAGPGIYIWGGEPTLELPTNPGTGGRNQSLALAVAMRIRGVGGVSLLVAGTDGTDGPTDDAGAYANGRTVDDLHEAGEAFRRADAGTFLGRRHSLFRSGPTGTNVMDLVIAVVE